MRKFVVSEAGVPPGDYLAAYLGVEDTNHIDYGPGLRFQFEVTEGEYAGRKVSRYAPPQPTLGNITGRIIAGLVGRVLRRDEELDIEQYVGQEYRVTVEATEKGSTRVAKVAPTCS